MNDFQTTVDFKPTSDYDKARQDVLKAISSIEKLSPYQQQSLAEELVGAANMAMLLDLFKKIYR